MSEGGVFLAQLREQLKISLMASRGSWTSAGFRPTCGVCRQPILEAPELHEAIITRGMWQGLPLEVIMVAANCDLVHPGGKNAGTCHQLAHSEAGQLICVGHILEHEGRAAVQDWLVSLRPLARSSVVEDCLRLLDLI